EEHPDGLGRFRRGRGETIREIELELVFGDGGLFRRVMINFIVVRAPSPYNVILGRTCLRTLRAVSSTIHSMNITKENKDEYRWTESAEKAFQEMKKVIV
nr:reverse transcriptase domain-containing protein [Tanacetum cinerariifolium]